MNAPVAIASQLLHSLSNEHPGTTATLKEMEMLEKFLDISREEEIGEGPIATKLIFLISSNRLCNETWIASKPAARWTQSILRLTKSLLKEKSLADPFHEHQKHTTFKQFIDTIANQYLMNVNESVFIQNATLAMNIIYRLSHSGRYASLFVDARTHKAVLPLLQSREMIVLQAVLEVLGRLSDWNELCRLDLCQSTAIDVCLQMAAESDLLTQKLCISLLRILACEGNAREQIKIYDGIPLLVSLLSMRNSRLQWHVAWTLAQLADDQECSLEIGQRGAISVILSELSLQQPPQRAVTDWISMLTGLCALLAQLCQTDSNEVLIIRNNGLYTIGQCMLLPLRHSFLFENSQFEPFLCSSFRVLRLLFSLERNRHFFKKVFDPEMFGKFIDVGHYVQDLTEYQELAYDFMKLMKEASMTDSILTAWDTLNQDKAPLGEVGEYEMLQQLGAGAFGCVYTVRKKTSPMQFYALKEIYMMESREMSPDKSFGDIISEVRIIKQQLRHPNIVRYRRIFVENQRLYIVMDLIDGASLKDHIHSTAEKKSRFAEPRVWNILVQLVLALRYLHKEKRIVHRDLKPNNIMLGDGDRVVITDFGLAKQRGAEYLKSAAGTIVYSCPEIVQNMPYGEKADIWSLGCSIYELCNLHPAFYSQNMLKLTMLIVEGTYEPVLATYSNRLRELIAACLDANDKNRPDIVQVGEYMVERLMKALDDQIRGSYKKAKEDASSSMHVSSSTLSFTASTSTDRDKKMSTAAAFTRSDSLNSSSNSEVLSASIREVRERDKKESKRVKLPMINNSVEKIGSEKKTVRIAGSKLKSLSAGSRTSLSNSLPRIGGLSGNGSLMNVNAGQPTSSLDVHASSHRRASSSSVAERSQRLIALRSHVLRPISDPVLHMLEVLHQLVLVCDLPPREGVDHKRRLLNNFRRKLFAKNAPSESIKIHLRKLSMESLDKVEMDLGYADFRVVLIDLPLYADSTDDKLTRVTYEQVARILQLVFTEAFPEARK
uniref:Protein kinase domain-containing protein n=1 Tax=Pristionchus pacificus TaxID=54126 RepID=A0A8R1YTC8_PRIPA